MFVYLTVVFLGVLGISVLGVLVHQVESVDVLVALVLKQSSVYVNPIVRVNP
jgi:hypothetical protein